MGDMSISIWDMSISVWTCPKPKWTCPYLYYLYFVKHEREDPVFVVVKIWFVDPDHIPFSFEPCELALCEMPCVPFENVDCVLKRSFSVEPGQDFFVAQALHGNHFFRAAHGF